MATVTKTGSHGAPVLVTVAMRKQVAELRQAAVALMEKRAASEPSIERVAELEALARQVDVVSPHQFWHGLAYRLWKTATPAASRQIVGA